MVKVMVTLICISDNMNYQIIRYIQYAKICLGGAIIGLALKSPTKYYAILGMVFLITSSYIAERMIEKQFQSSKRDKHE